MIMALLPFIPVLATQVPIGKILYMLLKALVYRVPVPHPLATDVDDPITAIWPGDSG